MAGPVVPLQSSSRQATRLAQSEDTFHRACRDSSLHTAGRIIIGIVSNCTDGSIKEMCWWKLLVVTNDNHATATCDCADCIFGPHLARFVHQHEIERGTTRRQKLRH